MSALVLKKLDRIATAVSVVVLAVVVLLRFAPSISTDALPFDIHVLPALHAFLNSLTAISLLIAVYFIKQKNITRHRQFIFGAMGFSGVFLLSYVFYHLVTAPTRFGGEGFISYLYYFLLITHIALAAILLPIILFTFNRGFTHQIAQHKRIARWTFPLWMYVAVTGVICYFMLAPYYQ